MAPSSPGGPPASTGYRGLPPARGVEGGERLGDPLEFRRRDDERRGDLQGHAAEQPGDHAALANVGDQPGGRPAPVRNACTAEAITRAVPRGPWRPEVPAAQI